MQILPNETVLTEAQGIPREIMDPLRPHICGGHAQLRRYSAASEKALCLLGTYGPDNDANYAWPNRTAGTLVDLSYVKVYIDDAHLRYHENLVGAGDVIANVSGYSNRVKLAGTGGDADKGYKANGDDYPRLDSLLDRDVQVNDVVWLRGTNGGDTSELWTYVQGFVANVIAATVGSADTDDNNPADQSASKTPSQTAGALNYVTLTSGNVVVTAYNGLPSGDINETYTIKVTQGSTGGDATTALLQVTSASGRDDVASVTPAAFGSPTTIGTRGATMQWTIDSGRAVDPGQPTSDFVVGQTFRVVLGQLFTAVVPTTAGSYTGPKDTSYKIEVTRGGLFLANLTLPAPNPNPQPTTSASGGSIAANTYYVKVTYSGSVSGQTDQPNAAKSVTTTGSSSTITVPSPTSVTGAANFKIYVGTSSSGPFYLQGTTNALASPVTLTSLTLSGTQIPTSNTALYSGNNPLGPQVTVTAPGVDSGVHSVTAANSAVSIGTFGVTFKTQAGVLGMRKGDLFYVDVTAPDAGAYQTLVLGHNLDATLKAATDLDMRLFIKKNVQVARERVDSPPDVNWSADQTYITLKSAITAYDEGWTDDGVQVALPIQKGTVYAQYRAWLTTYAAKNSMVVTGDQTTLRATFGPLHPDNPLGWAVFRAAQIAGELGVRFTAMADPTDLNEWTLALQMLEGQEGNYHLVPLSHDQAVHDLYVAHISSQSTDEKGMWRNCWLPLLAESTQVVVDSTKTVEADGSKAARPALATLKDDPAAVGTQYTLLECSSLNGKFVTNGVAVGDIVRFLYSVDGFGNETYTEFVVGSVVNEDTLLLQVGYSSAITTGQRFEVWRTLSKNDVADALVAKATSVLDQRVKYVWPDSIDGGGVTQDGMFAAAALAGLASRVAPHQGLAFVEVAGFDAVPRSTSYFNFGQLTRLKNGGIWVLSQAPTGEIYTFSARTTDVSEVNTREEMIVRATDAIRLHMRSRVGRYFGNGNLTDSLLSKVRADVNAGLQFLRSTTFIERIGNLIETSAIVDLRRHTTDEERLVLVLAITGPKPMNEATIAVVI